MVSLHFKQQQSHLTAGCWFQWMWRCTASWRLWRTPWSFGHRSDQERCIHWSLTCIHLRCHCQSAWWPCRNPTRCRPAMWPLRWQRDSPVWWRFPSVDTALRDKAPEFIGTGLSLFLYSSHWSHAGGVKPTRLYGGLCIDGAGTVPALRCHCKGVVLPTLQARKVGRCGVGGQLSFIVSHLGWHIVQLCPITGVPAQRNDTSVAIHGGRQVLRCAGFWKERKQKCCCKQEL